MDKIPIYSYPYGSDPKTAVRRHTRCDFKGTVTRDGYFFDSLNILISTFCVCDDGFQCVLKGFSLPYTNINFLFASLTLLTNFEKCPY
jgi:hypothetical protein